MKKNNFKNKIMMSAAIGTGVAMLVPGSFAFAETTQAHSMVKHTAQQQVTKENQQLEGIVNFTGGPFTYITREPNWDNDGIGQLYNGAPVKIIGQTNGWYKITYNGGSAWICKDRVETFNVTPVNKSGIVDFKGGAFTYVTSKPNWNNSGLGELYNGSPVRITGESGNWYQIKYNGGSAWICKDRVSMNVKTLNETGIVNFTGGPFTYITSKPNWNNSGVGKLYNGAAVNITGEYGNWYRIDNNGNSAWICKDRVETFKVTAIDKKGVVAFKGGPFTYVTSKPNWNNSGLGELYNGSPVRITGESGNWYQIKYNGGTAWICKDRVNIEAKTLNEIGVVNFEGGLFTYITREPNWNNDGVGALNNGTKVTIIGESGNWYEIEHQGGTAWICKDRVLLSNRIKSEEAFGTIKVKKGQDSYVYQVPNLKNGCMEELPNGANVTITGEYGNWYRINWPGNNGEEGHAWILKNTVEITTKVQKVSNEGTVDFKEGNFTYITREPNWNNDGVGALNNGTKVTIVGESGNWYQIEYQGGTAWICKDRVNIKTAVKPIVKVAPTNKDKNNKIDVTSKDKTVKPEVKTESKDNKTEVKTADQNKKIDVTSKDKTVKPEVNTENKDNKTEVKIADQNKKTDVTVNNKITKSEVKELNENGIVNYKNGEILKSQSNNSEKISEVTSGNKVKILAESGDWYKVEYNNKIGWILKDRVQVESATKDNSKTITNQKKKENVNSTIASNSVKEVNKGKIVNQ